MSVADLDSDPSHASAGDSDADDSEKLLLQSMLNQEQIYSLLNERSLRHQVHAFSSVKDAVRRVCRALVQSVHRVPNA